MSTSSIPEPDPASAARADVPPSDHAVIWQVSRDLLGVADMAGVWLEVNPAWTATLGWPAEQFIGRTSDWVEHPDDVARKHAEVRALASGKITEHFENRFRTIDGDYRLLSWTAVPSGDRLYCVARDITRDREQELALRDSMDFARLALSAVSGVGVWTYEVESDRFFCDAAISALYAIDPVEAAGGIVRSRFLANVHPDDVPSLRATMQGGLLKSGDLELEYRVCHPDGSVRWVLSRGHTYFDADGAPRRRTGIGVDMTRQRETEQQLRQSQKMEAVGQLTGGIAHDFNNMLQGVMGPLELLRGRLAPAGDPAAARYIEMALGSTRRAAALTHRLLAFSRRQPLDPQLIDANALVAALADLLVRTGGDAVALALDLAPEPCRTRCDANQLENALLNLTINARDAMPGGGKLTIQTSHIDIDASYARVQRDVQPGRYVCIAVTDTGTGMPPQVASQAFEPFFTTKPLGQGTGLGLSMVHGFAGQSGGFASINSVPAMGTTIRIYLPAADDGLVTERASGQSAVPLRDGGGATILVVEDEPAVRGLLADVLGEAGYRVLAAAEGTEALSMLKAERHIDLLITDVGLPGLNGRQVAEAARHALPQLPVLFMTGYAQLTASSGGFLETGMTLIAKPFKLQDMLARVQQILAG